jgi:hypothetical protein
MSDVTGGHASLVGYVNTGVHVVMYSYYFVTSMWPEYRKNLWWKKYITQLQMVNKRYEVIFWGFHYGDYEEIPLLGCHATWLLLKPTFRLHYQGGNYRRAINNITSK